MDAVASELRGMDAAYERCVKKAVIYSGKKTIWGQLSLLTFSTGLEKVKSPTGRNTL